MGSAARAVAGVTGAAGAAAGAAGANTGGETTAAPPGCRLITPEVLAPTGANITVDTGMIGDDPPPTTGAAEVVLTTVWAVTAPLADAVVAGVVTLTVTVVTGVNAAALIMLLLALSPKLSAAVAALPTYVLGGAGMVMFGMVAAAGIRIILDSDLAGKPNNLFVIAISLSVGMVPVMAPTLLKALPGPVQPLVGSGIVLATLCAVLLNLYFNGASDIPVSGETPV